MGTAYYDWDATWTVVTYGSGTNFTSVAIADEGDLLSDVLSLDGKVAAEISVEVVEDNTGACDGKVLVHVCRETGDSAYQDFTADDDNDSPALACSIVAEQNKTRKKAFTIDAAEVSKFKLAVDNDCGQEVAVSIKIKYAVMTTA